MRFQFNHSGALAAVLTVFAIGVTGMGVLWTAVSRDRILLVETTLVLGSLVIAVTCPQVASKCLEPLDNAIESVSARPVASLVAILVLTLGLRAALLPIFPIPVPRIHDEFSHLLAGETFASGRLTNPTPPLWQHFESFHIELNPTYMSMYPPAQGFFLALGIALGGIPWIGVWLSTGLMCAAMCWAIRGWLPPYWAFVGAVLVTLRVGTLSYFANSYWGGSVAALGGALMAGALPRIKRDVRYRDAVLMCIGIALVANTRPYEGFFLGLMMGGSLAAWMSTRSRDYALWSTMARITVAMLAMLTFMIAFMAFYNARVYGSPLVLPYQVNRATYAVTPVLPWEHIRPAPEYNHKVFSDFFLGWELREYNASHTLSGRLEQTSWKVVEFWNFYVGPVLTAPFLLAAVAGINRRLRILWLTALLFIAVSAVGVFFNPHYIAPAAAVIFILLTQGMRRVYVWRWQGKPSGVFLVRSTVPICVATLVIVACAPARFAKPWPDYAWYYFIPNGTPRERLTIRLHEMGGRHLVFVRYSDKHNPFQEWVYNSANMGDSAVVWARDMGGEKNARLVDYFRNRRVWILEPDRSSTNLLTYTCQR